MSKRMTYAENLLKWRVGCFNIDACRVGSETTTINVYDNGNNNHKFLGSKEKEKDTFTSKVSTGRFPANLILSHTSDCEYLGVEEEKVNNSRQVVKGAIHTANGQNDNRVEKNVPYTTTTTKYNCSDECPCKLLDDQSGISKSKLKMTDAGIGAGCMAKHDGRKTMPTATKKEKMIRTYEGEGGASRFFIQIEAEDG